ncbi:hypothetical protein Tco_0710387 [Tanacetum coccineum]
MGDRHSFNSKEDQTQKMSKSVFVMNFPDDYCACDLWNVQKEPRNYVSQPKKVNESIVKNSFATVMKTDVDSLASKEKIHKHVGFASWFNELIPARNLFVSEDRVVWVPIEGVPIKTLTRKTYAKLISPWGERIDVENLDNMYLRIGEAVALKTKINVIINKHAFKYNVKGHVFWIHVKELESWTPDFSEELGDSTSSDEEYEDEQKSGNKESKFVLAKETEIDHVFESSCMHRE